MEKKNIYRGREIKYYDEFMSWRGPLLEDFNRTHKDYKDFFEMGGCPPHTPGGMRASMVIYKPAEMDIPVDYDGHMAKTSYVKELAEEAQSPWNTPENYPTVYNIIAKRFPECVIGVYSMLNPHSVITRHTGPENRDGIYVRIHIPLIVPDGDIGFEVACETVDWSDLFAFNNQKVHSAWNNTELPRLVFIMDLPRSILDMPKADAWDIHDVIHTPRFIKGEKPLRDFTDEELDQLKSLS